VTVFEMSSSHPAYRVGLAVLVGLAVAGGAARLVQRVHADDALRRQPACKHSCPEPAIRGRLLILYNGASHWNGRQRV